MKSLIEREFEHLKTLYFNTAYLGPCPFSVKEACLNSLEKELNPSLFKDPSDWIEISERVRVQLATFLNCSPDQITHSTSSSDISNNIVQSYPFKKEDSVAGIDGDYPSNILPWLLAQHRRRCQFQRIRLDIQTQIDVEWLEKNLSKTTVIFTISHVAFDTGKRINLKKIGKYLRSRKILFIVDATQSLGGLEITLEELKEIDLLVCSTYKWMLGPYGHAFAYMSKRALDIMEHQNGNWLSMPNMNNFDNILDYTIKTIDGARKYDRGQTPNMLLMTGLEASVKFLNRVTPRTISQHNFELRDFFLKHYNKTQLTLITPLHSLSQILILKTLKIDSTLLLLRLREKGVDASVREGNLRLSFHIFNRREDVEVLLEYLAELAC